MCVATALILDHARRKADLALKLANQAKAAASEHVSHAHEQLYRQANNLGNTAAYHATHANEHTHELARRASTKLAGVSGLVARGKSDFGSKAHTSSDRAEDTRPEQQQQRPPPSPSQSPAAVTTRSRPLAKAGAGGRRHTLSPRADSSDGAVSATV